MFWCIVCDGWRILNRLLLLGNTDAAADDALQFPTFTPHVVLLVEPGKDELSPEARRKLQAAGAPTLLGQVQSERLSGAVIESVLLRGGATMQVNLIFGLYGSDPNTELLRKLPIQLTERGMIDVDPKYHTSLERFER